MDNLVVFNMLRQPRFLALGPFGVMGDAIRLFVRGLTDLRPVVEGQERIAVVAGDGMPVGLRELAAALATPESGRDGAVNVVSVAE